MADKRMFTKEIVESDDFLDMPFSTRCLYFHLNLNADDDGFLNSPNKVMRISNASEDDLNMLIEKRFILSFGNGVICVKHWLMHNTLKKDRYKATKYQEQLAMLEVKENGAYTERNHFGTEMEPERNHSIDKNSIDKSSIEEERESNSQQIADLFNSLCPSFPSVKILSDSRKKTIKARLKQYTIDDFRTLFEKAEASDFLKGENARQWSANFDWLINESNMAKVLEGNYDSRQRKSEYDAIEQKAMQKLMEESEPKTIADDPDLKARADALREKIKTTA